MSFHGNSWASHPHTPQKQRGTGSVCTLVCLLSTNLLLFVCEQLQGISLGMLLSVCLYSDDCFWFLSCTFVTLAMTRVTVQIGVWCVHTVGNLLRTGAPVMDDVLHRLGGGFIYVRMWKVWSQELVRSSGTELEERRFVEFCRVLVVVAAAMEMDMVTFTVIVDDIVYPDGHTAMACLGGGGSLFGLLLLCM